QADKIYLATDPDREGEAISWHLMFALKLDAKKTSRITFNEITKTAVKRSIKEARDINMNLVDAQQARRELDRIVGYKISPLLWKKVKRGLSAGRVQSVAMRIICDREEDIENFNPEEYWTLESVLSDGKLSFTAKYNSNDNGKKELKNKEDCDCIIANIESKPWIVKDVRLGSRVKNPSAPFTTSTLQQEASKILGYATAKTMMVAQQLYEGVDIVGKGTLGLVTYIRTDSVRIADEAYEAAKTWIVSKYGKDYLPAERTIYKSRGRAQDAHEAIRPSYVDLLPEDVKDSLTNEQYKLYKLIWERFIASQMSSAVYNMVSVKISVGDYIFRSGGSILHFKGYLIVYNKNETEKDADVSIPELRAGQEIKFLESKPEQHFTQPPPRYSEANLVKTMEDLGIGRPSTYASTISTIVHRGYVCKENKVFFPTELGEIVNDIMRRNFENIVDIEFTAKMEESLDKVEEGDLEWKEILRGFYTPFSEKIKRAEELIGEIEVEDEKTDVICEHCGRNMVIKYGRFGKFMACPGFPECKNTKPFFEDAGVNCPVCGGKVQIKKTRKGRKYYGCENNPECGFMTWSRPSGETCPDCGGYLVEKGVRHRKIVCSNVQCGFSKELPPEEVDKEA
ncbi:MAG: type I DNA topoisomerase, partial [Clostridiales bacterium]|nr:type I DNA topoisomerase [Clostridiales bacterium]